MHIKISGKLWPQRACISHRAVYCRILFSAFSVSSCGSDQDTDTLQSLSNRCSQAFFIDGPHNLLWGVILLVDILPFRTSGESDTMSKFEVFTDKSGKYRFRLKAGNGEIIATGQAYANKASCMNGIESVRKNAPIAEVVEIHEPEEAEGWVL